MNSRYKYIHLTEEQERKLLMSSQNDEHAQLKTIFARKHNIKGFEGKLYRLVEVLE